MSLVVYRICLLLEQVLVSVPVGTNLGLYCLLWALLSGQFLLSRGAVFAALLALGLSPEAVRRSAAALTYGRWSMAGLLAVWQKSVLQQGQWHAHSYEGFRPVVCDGIGFFRPKLRGCVSKHYQSQSDRALPAIVLAVVAAVGSVGKQRLALPRLLVRGGSEDKSERDLQRRALLQMAATLAQDETAVVDAGFSLEDLFACGVARFVARVAKNATFRRNFLPERKERGRPAEYGEVVRPLARTHAGKKIRATQPDTKVSFKEGRHRVRAHLFENLVLSDQKPGAPALRCVVILHPRYKEPWVLVTNLPLSPEALFRLYRDRWPVEQLPLAAKPLLGAQRAFVFGSESRYRLPELALLAGNILSYVAATSQAVASGFWDRCARPTCGRLRRQLLRLHFSELPLPEGQLRKKNSPTQHLPKGVSAHRRTKKTHTTPNRDGCTSFTGN